MPYSQLLYQNASQSSIKNKLKIKYESALKRYLATKLLLVIAVIELTESDKFCCNLHNRAF